MNPQERTYLFNLWKHYEEAGGTDKNRMISLSTWLLALAGTILGFLMKESINLEEPAISQPHVVIGGSILGILLAILAILIVRGFAFYANLNWASANIIAEDLAPIPDTRKEVLEKMKETDHVPSSGKMAPIFLYFIWFSYGMMGVFTSLLILAITSI